MGKIILCYGDAFTPARYWGWSVVEREEYTEEMKKKGLAESECTAYLTMEQKEYLRA